MKRSNQEDDNNLKETNKRPRLVFEENISKPEDSTLTQENFSKLKNALEKQEWDDLITLEKSGYKMLEEWLSYLKTKEDTFNINDHYSTLGYLTIFLFTHNKKESLKILVEEGFKWEKDDIWEWEFFSKIKNLDPEVYSLFLQLDIGQDIIETIFRGTIYGNNFEVTEFLLTQHDSVMLWDSIIEAINDDEAYFIDLFQKNNIKEVRWLVTHGIKPDDESIYYVDSIEMAKVLLDLVYVPLHVNSKGVSLFEDLFEEEPDVLFPFIGAGLDVNLIKNSPFFEKAQRKEDIETLKVSTYTMAKIMDKFSPSYYGNSEEDKKFFFEKFNEELIEFADCYEKEYLSRFKNHLINKGLEDSYENYIKSAKEIAIKTNSSLFHKISTVVENFQEECAADEAQLLTHLTGIYPLPLYSIIELNNLGIKPNETKKDTKYDKTFEFYARHPACTDLITKYLEGIISNDETLNLIEILKNHTGEYLDLAISSLSVHELTLILNGENALINLEYHLSTYAMPQNLRAKLKAVLNEEQLLKAEADFGGNSSNLKDYLETISSLNNFAAFDNLDTDLIGNITQLEDLG